MPRRLPRPGPRPLADELVAVTGSTPRDTGARVDIDAAQRAGQPVRFLIAAAAH